MPRGFESHPLRGEVLEWPIRRAWRARVANGDRGFESHPLRHHSNLPTADSQIQRLAGSSQHKATRRSDSPRAHLLAGSASSTVVDYETVSLLDAVSLRRQREWIGSEQDSVQPYLW